MKSEVIEGKRVTFGPYAHVYWLDGELLMAAPQNEDGSIDWDNEMAAEDFVEPLTKRERDAILHTLTTPSAKALGHTALPETANLQFNQDWAYLSQYFAPANLPNGFSLYVGKKPDVIRAHEWPHVIAAIISVTEIGRRNHWLNFHQDYSGRPAILYLPFNYEADAAKVKGNSHYQLLSAAKAFVRWVDSYWGAGEILHERTLTEYENAKVAISQAEEGL